MEKMSIFRISQLDSVDEADVVGRAQSMPSGASPRAAFLPPGPEAAWTWSVSGAELFELV